MSAALICVCSVGYYDNVTKACVPACPDGTYADQTMKTCYGCNVACASCTGNAPPPSRLARPLSPD